MCYEVSYYVDKVKSIKSKIPKKREDGTIYWSPVSSSASSVRSFMSNSSRSKWSRRSKSPQTPVTPPSPPPPQLPEFFCLFPNCKYATDRKGDLETHVKFAHNLAINGRK